MSTSTAGSSSAQPLGDLSGTVRGRVVDDEHPVLARRIASSSRQTPRSVRSMFPASQNVGIVSQVAAMP